MKEIINNEIFKSTIEVLIPFIITFVLGLIENHKSKTIKAAYPAIVKLVDSLFNNKDSNLKREHAVNYLRAEILATTPKYLRWLVYPFVNTYFLKYKADKVFSLVKLQEKEKELSETNKMNFLINNTGLTKENILIDDIDNPQNNSFVSAEAYYKNNLEGDKEFGTGLKFTKILK